jgi:hypothetical protein
VLLLSPTLRQSGALFKKAATVYSVLGRLRPPESESAWQLELETGSRIVSLLGKEGTIRGYSGVRLLSIDEQRPRTRLRSTACKAVNNTTAGAEAEEDTRLGHRKMISWPG